MLEPGDYSYLAVEIRDQVAIATRNRPELGNRYTPAEGAEYPRFLAQADADPRVRVVVVTGAGSEWFCAGVDEPDHLPDVDYDAHVGSGRDAATPWDPPAALRERLAGPLGMAGVLLDGADRMRRPLRFRKPSITALNGGVAGAALTSVLQTDIIVAERHVQMRDVHVNAGLVAATGALLWPASTGVMRAKRWLLTGDWIDAEEAERIGVVTEVVDTGRSLERAMAYATHLASLRPESLQLTKRAINQWLLARNDDVFGAALTAEFMLFPGADT